jgi:predicted RNA-binding Zn-ribbon protein involved in translation (DUF1610 family)
MIVPVPAVAKFRCPSCGRWTISRVLDTRDAYRRRRCQSCSGTFKTVEVVMPWLPVGRPRRGYRWRARVEAVFEDPES